MAQLPAGAVALYRIMTEKSLPGFGKYADLPIGDILKVDPEYVVWLYANYEKLSLKKDIIERLGIREIKKPGTDPEVLKEYQRAQTAQYSREERNHYFMKMAASRKKKAMADYIDAREAAHYTKGELQAINHGHGRGSKKHY